MTADGNPRRCDTTVSRSVLALLYGHRFASAYLDQHQALADNRQYFFNVLGDAEQQPNGTSLYNSSGVNALVVFLRLLLNYA